MNQTTGTTSAPNELKDLLREFREHVETLKREWLHRNRIDSKEVYEVMRPEERVSVNTRIRAWERYITPLSETWWKERGYNVIWPDDNSKPMQIQKLESA